MPHQATGTVLERDGRFYAQVTIAKARRRAFLLATIDPCACRTSPCKRTCAPYAAAEEHLKVAGVERPSLFEKSATRLPLRAHDLRATFVTLSLASGKTEAWVSDRTGHKSSTMINRYRRRARAGLPKR
jgi:integrase